MSFDIQEAGRRIVEEIPKIPQTQRAVFAVGILRELDQPAKEKCGDKVRVEFAKMAKGHERDSCLVPFMLALVQAGAVEKAKEFVALLSDSSLSESFLQGLGDELAGRLTQALGF